MTKLGIFAATILAAAGACCGVSAANAAPKTCTGVWDFIETDCQLTWYGITLYGAIDAGFGYQTHGAPLDTRSHSICMGFLARWLAIRHGRLISTM
jgi:hypothetical protein